MKPGLRAIALLLPVLLLACCLSGCGKAKEKETEKEKGKGAIPRWTKLNLGCGEDIREGYDNIDLYYPDPRVIKMDIRRLAYADNTIDEILASHVLEHLSYSDVDVVVQEMYRVLKPGGKVIIDVPDLEAMVRIWLDLPEERRWGPESRAFAAIFGTQQDEGNFHKNGFTKARLRKVLADVGFRSIEVKSKLSHGTDSLYAEAKK